MSLFIWNDRRWQFIEANCDYDKKNYVVVNKLFIRWQSESSNPTELNGSILKAFEKFGEIKSVESVKTKAALDKSDVHEAYVTFFRSEDAYKAFIENRKEKKSSEEVISVLPVDSWKVLPIPTKTDELSEVSLRITKVKDEEDPHFFYRMHITPAMLLRIFRSFLRVAKHFLNGIILYYELDEAPYTSDDDSDSSDDDSESNSADDHKSDDDSLSQMDLSYDYESTESETDHIENHEFDERIAQVMAKNLGPKFETITLHRSSIPVEWLTSFAPVLKQLHQLTIYTVFDCNILFMLHKYCPLVENFNLDGEEWGSGETAIAPWPSLKELFLNTPDFEESGSHVNQNLMRFMELNPQITSLEIKASIDMEVLSTIGKTLNDLATFAFVRNNFEGLNSVLDNISGLTTLNGLKLTVRSVEKVRLDGLVKCAKRLKRLNELEVITMFMNCEPDTETPEDFDHLNEFSITHHNGCPCHAPNRVLSFFNNDIIVPNDRLVLAIIINTKPPSKSADTTLQQHIMSTLKKTTKSFPHIIEQIQLQPKGRDNFLFIQISSDHP